MKAAGKTVSPIDVTIAPAYQFWLPCRQASPDTTVTDASGNGAHAIFGGDFIATEAWTNAGWCTTVDGASDDTFQVPASKITWDMAEGHSFLLAMRTNSVTKTDQDGLLGTAGTTSETGFRCFVNTDGKIQTPGICDGTTFTGDTNAYGADLSAAEHHTVFGCDGSAKTLLLWQDGVNLQAGADVSATDGSTQPGLNLFFGSDAETNDTVGAQFKDIHFLVWQGAMPSNITEIINLMYSRPFVPLSATEFPMTAVA